MYMCVGGGDYLEFVASSCGYGYVLVYYITAIVNTPKMLTVSQVLFYIHQTTSDVQTIGPKVKCIRSLIHHRYGGSSPQKLLSRRPPRKEVC